MKCKSVSNTIDIDVLILYGTLKSLLENGNYSKEIKSKVNELLNYVYFQWYPYEKINSEKDIISLSFKCDTKYKN